MKELKLPDRCNFRKTVSITFLAFEWCQREIRPCHSLVERTVQNLCQDANCSTDISDTISLEREILRKLNDFPDGGKFIIRSCKKLENW